MKKLTLLGLSVVPLYWLRRSVLMLKSTAMDIPLIATAIRLTAMAATTGPLSTGPAISAIACGGAPRRVAASIARCPRLASQRNASHKTTAATMIAAPQLLLRAPKYEFQHLPVAQIT
jgi:hypothetical protein